MTYELKTGWFSVHATEWRTHRHWGRALSINTAPRAYKTFPRMQARSGIRSRRNLLQHAWALYDERPKSRWIDTGCVEKYWPVSSPQKSVSIQKTLKMSSENSKKKTTVPPTFVLTIHSHILIWFILFSFDSSVSFRLFVTHSEFACVNIYAFSVISYLKPMNIAFAVNNKLISQCDTYYKWQYRLKQTHIFIILWSYINNTYCSMPC